MPSAAARGAVFRSLDLSYLGKLVALALGYFIAAKASLLLAIPPGYATAVWPPSGIALAATLLYGGRMWPGIWIGAALANFSIDQATSPAIAIATGNTLEAVCACWLARQFIAPPVAAGFLHPESAFRFAGVVAIGSAVAATVGVGALLLSGRVVPEELLANWYTWWQGDATGMIVLTPFALAWLRRSAAPAEYRRSELLVFAILLALTLAAVFELAGRTSPDIARSLTFLLIPFMAWAGCRFDERIVTASILAVTGTVIWFTVHNQGPFLFSSRNESLLVLQAFISTIALLGLVLCALTRVRTDGVAALQQAHKQLEATVLERTAELARKNVALARDIEEKEQLTAILQRREAQLAEAQALSHIGSWTWDIQSDRVSWSDELFRIYGLAPDAFSASFQGYISRVHPEDRQRVAQNIRTAVEHRRPWELSERIIRPDGSVRVLRSIGKVLTNDAGEAITLYGVCVDDTERVRLERIQDVQLAVTSALLQTSSWRDAVTSALRSVCETLGWALGQMWRVDKTASVLRHASAWHPPAPELATFVEDGATMTFAPGRGLPGRTWHARRAEWIEDVVVDANFPRAGAALRANLHAAFALPLIAGGEVLGVIEFFSRETQKPQTEVLETLMALGSQLGEYIVRSESQALLKQSEERFRLLVESVKDYAIFMLDTGGHVATWNPGAGRIKGYGAEEIIGQHFSRFYTRQAIAAKQPEQALMAAVVHGHFEEEGWRVRKDGSRFWAHAVITAVHDAEARLHGFAQVTRDMSDRKRVEALEEAGRQTRKFLAMLGHELRNPLAPIRNAVSIMHAHGLPQPELERCRAMIERQVGHLSRLVDDLLDAGRITSGKIELRRERIDLVTVLARALESSRPLIDARGQKLEVRLPRSPMPVNGDLVRLSQVVQNLLNNAVKFTPDGGRIELSLAREGDNGAIRVRDTGIGIGPDLLPKVFDLFAQGDRGLDRSEGGLGIGLTLVREITHLHVGSVQALSLGEGRGAEFVVRLPLLAANAVCAEPNGESGAPQASTARRVLVVDDNHDAADSMATLLRVWGHQAWSAYDGDSALSLAVEHCPEVVLLDIGLPGMDGYQVARRLRGLADTRDTVLIALTGYGQSEDRTRSQEAGFNLHLVKPVDIEALRQLIG